MNSTFEVEEKRSRSLLKGITFKILEVGVNFFVLNLAFGEPLKSLSIAVLLETNCFLLYYINERIWNKINLGRVVSKKKSKYRWQKLLGKKCKGHSKYFVLQGDPCVEEYFNGKFWERMDRIVQLIQREVNLTSRGKTKIVKGEVKWGRTDFAYSYDPSEVVMDGLEREPVLALLHKEKLFRASEVLPFLTVQQSKAYLEEAKEKLKFFIGKELPKTHRILKNIEDDCVLVTHYVPKALKRAMERQRRLNPDLAHYITDSIPDCDCKFEFFCEKYAHVPLWQKLIDKIVVLFLLTLIYLDNSRKTMSRKWEKITILTKTKWGGFIDKSFRIFRCYLLSLWDAFKREEI